MGIIPSEIESFLYNFQILNFILVIASDDHQQHYSLINVQTDQYLKDIEFGKVIDMIRSNVIQM